MSILDNEFNRLLTSVQKMCMIIMLMYDKCNACCVDIIHIRLSMFFFFSRQKTAYKMGISDWISDVCSSDLPATNRMNVRAIHHYLQGRERIGDRKSVVSGKSVSVSVDIGGRRIIKKKTQLKQTVRIVTTEYQ